MNRENRELECTVEYGVDVVGIQMGIQVNKEYRQVGTGLVGNKGNYCLVWNIGRKTGV